MKLDYSLSKEQLRAFSKLSCQRLRSRGGARWGITALNILAWACIAFATAALVSMYEKAPYLSPELNSIAIPFVLAATAILAASFYQQRLQSNAVLADDSWPRIQQSVSAEPGGLEITAPGVHSHYDWGRFVEVHEDVAAIYLFLDASHAVVVPKTSFPSPEDLQQFLSWAKSPNKLLHATRETRAPEQWRYA